MISHIIIQKVCNLIDYWVCSFLARATIMAIPVMEFQVRGHTIVVIQSYLKIDVIKKCEKIVLLDWYSSTKKQLRKILMIFVPTTPIL